MNLIFMLFFLGFGLGLVGFVAAMLWNLRGKPDRSPLITVGTIAVFLFQVVGGLIFLVGSTVVVQQSLIRGTVWYQRRTAHKVWFFVWLGVFAFAGLKSIFAGVRDLRRKKTPHS